MNNKKAKQPYCCCGEGLSSLDRRSNRPQHSLKLKPNLEKALTLFDSLNTKRGEEVQKKSLKLAEVDARGLRKEAISIT